jgi:hypothetical protein
MFGLPPVEDPEGNERDGEVRVTLFRQRGRFSFGFDSQARLALGMRGGKTATVESTFDATGGPVATVALGSLAVFAGVGPSAFALAGTTRIGGAVFAGVGSAF